MNRQEVIDWLYRIQSSVRTHLFDVPKLWHGSIIEALGMAIKALEQEPTPTTKNDLGVDWDELKRKIFMEVDGGTDDKWLSYADVCDNISNSIDEFKADLPSATPQEPRKGHWIKFPVGWKCSNCTLGTNDRGADSFNFCPNCGADMRADRSEDNGNDV